MSPTLPMGSIVPAYQHGTSNTGDHNDYGCRAIMEVPEGDRPFTRASKLISERPRCEVHVTMVARATSDTGGKATNVDIIPPTNRWSVRTGHPKCTHIGKLHCTGPDVLLNGYSVAVEDGLVDSHQTLTNRPRIHCIRVIRSTERVRILCWQHIIPDRAWCEFFHARWGA